MSDETAALHDLFLDRGIHLSPIEAKLLLVLKRRARSVSHESLIETLWGDDPDGGPLDARADLKVFIHKCRQKIKESGLPWEIQNTRGFGYRFIES